ncbi:hypothetical protein [Mesorhizobium sp. URHB0026]
MNKVPTDDILRTALAVVMDNRGNPMVIDVADAINAERERCANIALAINSGRGNEMLIACAIMSGEGVPSGTTEPAPVPKA